MSLSPHARAQILRFARLTAATLVAWIATSGGKVSWATLLVALPGMVENVVRQMRKVVPADSQPVPTVTSEPPPDPTAGGVGG